MGKFIILKVTLTGRKYTTNLGSDNLQEITDLCKLLNDCNKDQGIKEYIIANIL